MDAEEPAVGDRPGIRNSEAGGPATPPDDTGRPVPDDPRPQLGELVGGVPAREHVEHVLELDAGKVGKRVGAVHELQQLVHLDLLLRRDRDDLLAEDVQRIARDLRLLDRALLHPADDDCRFEQVGAELREDTALGDGGEVVAGAADPLETARDGLRRLDLDDEVDGAHVDPKLERRRCDEARDLPALQQLLDLEPLLAGKGAVVSPRDLFLGQFVESQRQPLGQPAVVDEDDGRAVSLDELEEARIDRRPDRLTA